MSGIVKKHKCPACGRDWQELVLGGDPPERGHCPDCAQGWQDCAQVWREYGPAMGDMAHVLCVPGTVTEARPKPRPRPRVKESPRHTRVHYRLAAVASVPVAVACELVQVGDGDDLGDYDDPRAVVVHLDYPEDINLRIEPMRRVYAEGERAFVEWGYILWTVARELVRRDRIGTLPLHGPNSLYVEGVWVSGSDIWLEVGS